MTSLAAALVAAQKKMPVVHKTARANYGNYATLDAIIEKTKPVLAEHDLVIAQFPAETSAGQPGLKTVLLHGASGESIEATVPLLLNGKNDMQALGGAITYARRYGWAAVLGIANDEDDDGDTVSAPGTGATSSPSAVRETTGAAGAADGISGTSAAPQFVAPTPTAHVPEGWTYPLGKHKGQTVAEVEEADPGWHDWFLENGKKDDIKDRIREHRNMGELSGAGEFVDDIPFDRSIDGLGG